jgi:hypothetical protein
MMDKDLKEWTVQYVKHRDLTQKKIVKIEEKKGDVLEVQYKDKTVKYHVIDSADIELLKSISNNEHKAIVCPNSEENFRFLIKNWSKLSTIGNLSIIFINMKTHEKWQINPKVHSMIADPESIEQGLRTMYDTANGKVTDAPKAKKKPQIFESNSSEEAEEDLEDN